MSEVKVNKISPRTACGTVQLGDSGDTITIPAGATITNNGTQTGFGRTGTVDWQTTPKTATFTAVSGEGYFANTSGGAFTMNLPAGSAGAIVSVADYAATWQTNNLTISANGSEKIGNSTLDVTLNTQGQSVTLVYVDSTQGWINTMDSTSNVRGPSFLTATGGNAVVTCGNFKTHIFTGPGTFAVSALSSAPACNVMDYVVVAGGGGTGNTGCQRGGGGAGGFRVSNHGCVMPGPTTSPLANPTGLTATVTSYPITVGAGGAAGGSPTANNGANSIFSTITSAGGGGGYCSPSETGKPGGSGGGAASSPAGSGNTPPVSPPQGNPGGTGSRSGPHYGSGGGGGAGASGANGTSGSAGGGGAGSYIADTFIGPTAPSYGTPGPASSTRYFAGGGGGGGEGVYGPGGVGGGGDGSSNPGSQAEDGTVNTGGGAGTGNDSLPAGKSGGSGIVMIRYKYQ